MRASAGKSRLLLAIVLGVVVSGVSAWIIGSTVDLDTTLKLLNGASPGLLILALAPLAVSMVLRTARWAVLLESASAKRPGTAQLLPVVLGGWAANAILPLRLGDVARAGAGSRRFQIGFAETIGTVGLERVLDAGALASVALAASMVVAVPAWLSQTSGLLIGAAVTFLGVMYALHHTVGRLHRQPSSMLSRLMRGLRPSLRSVAVAFSLSVVVWCIDGLTFWTVARAIGVDLGLMPSLLIATGAAAGGILPSAPAALGTFELAGTAVGVAAGLDGATALGIVALGHAVTVVPLLVAGGLSLPIIGLRLADLGAGSVTPLTAQEASS